MKKVRLAELMEVDVRTVGRWEASSAVPSAVLPALRQYLPIPGDEGQAPNPTPAAPAAPRDLEIAAALRWASPEQLLQEVAERMRGHRPSDAELPSVPTGRYRLPKSKAPSRRVEQPHEQTDPSRETGP